MGLIHVYAAAGDLVALRRLIEEQGVDVNTPHEHFQGTPLFYACADGQIDAARFLLDHGADVNRQDHKGRTCVMASIVKDETSLALVQLLLSRGADLYLHTLEGYNVLQLAVCTEPRPSPELIRLLIGAGRALIDAQTPDGQTALYAACVCDHADMAKLLLVEGRADERITNGTGETALETARVCRNVDCVKVFEWFSGELERAYCLAKARQIEDDREAIHQAPTKAGARTAEEAQRAREQAAAEHVRGRVVRGEELARVEVGSMPRRSKRRGREAALEGEEVRRAVVQHVVMAGSMKEDCFVELMGLMKMR